MKSDDHNFGGNLNDGNADGDSSLPRELEARIVAAIAGEASAFETAELERLAAETPTVAEFKQRIESVHGLVTAAAKPDAPPLRLSAERRAKVLAAIGAVESASKDVPASVVEMSSASKPSRRKGVLPWALAVAAAACIPFLTVFSVRFERASEKPARPDPSQTVLGPAPLTVTSGAKSWSASGPTGVVNGVADRSVQLMSMPQASALDLPVFADARSVSTGATNQSPPPPTQNFATNLSVVQPPIKPSGFGGAAGAKLPYFGQSLALGANGTVVSEEATKAKIAGSFYDSNIAVAAATPAAAALPPPDSDIVKMDAFEVSATREGYAAAMSLSASRASVNVVAPPSLTEVAQLNTEIMTRDSRVGADEQQAQTAGASDRSILNQGTGSATTLGSFQVAPGDTFNFTQPSGGAVLDPVAPQNSPVTIGGTLTIPTPSSDIVAPGLGGKTAASETMFGVAPVRMREEARLDLSKELADRRKLNQMAAAGQQAQETVALNEGVVTLSPFQVSSDKDTGYAKAITHDAMTESGGKLSLSDYTNSMVLGTVTVSGDLTSRFGSIVGDADKKQVARTDPLRGSISGTAIMTKAIADGEKADAPLARAKAPTDESLRLETATATQSVSTFSMHVSDVSFRLAQAALARGEAPDPAAIRPEEFYNAFNYGDPAPAEAEKVGSRIEQSAHPFLAQRNLLRIALKVAATGRVGSTPLHLTVLLDTSGSMEREDRAATVRRAMDVLVSLLGPNDRLTLIGFARQPRLLAENLSGDRAREVLDIIARTPADGGTNMEEALKLASQLALRHRDAKAQNRVVMLTDGAANLGNAVPEQLATRIEELRQRGIAFDACGVGLDGLDDGILEALTRKGDGRYYVLNSPDDAGGGFAQKLAGAFRPAAENVKVQVRFNPARVATYRLIGFEQHRLKEQDFRNDKVDAAELAAEEAGVALYQFEPLPQGEGDVGEVFVRFRDPATGAMVERSWMIPYEARVAAFDRATPSLQLAGVAALLAEKLRADAGAAQITLRDFATVMSTLQTRYRNEPRVQELATMFAQTRRLTGQ